MRFIASAAQLINSAGYAFTLMTHLDDNIGHLEQFAASGLVSGFILMQVQMHDPPVDYLQRRKIPFVLICCCEDNTGLSYVDSHIEQGMRQCVGHLADLGHQRIAFLNQDDHDFGFSVRAMQSFADVCQRLGIEPIHESCDLSFASGAAVFAVLLDKRPQTTAIIVWNDNAAAGVVEAALVHGIRIPQELSLISFNQLVIFRGFGRCSRPCSTSVLRKSPQRPLA